MFKFRRTFNLLCYLQNKSKRPEAKRPTEAGKDNVLDPDTGQSAAMGRADHPEEVAAAASTSSPTNNNNNGNNYNLVTSLLNLTKSPVSNPH